MDLLSEWSEINESHISITHLCQIVCTEGTAGALITELFNVSKLTDQFK